MQQVDQTTPADASESTRSDPDARPDDCRCAAFSLGDRDDLPCWPCYQHGFRTRPEEWTNDADD
jgi:hypothetical protein